MKAEIITIGDEILIGQITDSNSAWIARELNLVGFSVFQITSVSDDKKHIINALNESKLRVDLIIMTGGLGPTRDDITKNTLCEYFNCDLIVDKDVLEHIEQFFSIRGIKLSSINKKQAEIPSVSEPLKNIHGTAPGMWIDQHGTIYVSLPGVPYEMKSIMKAEVLPRLKEKFKCQGIIHKTILTQGIAESHLAERIKIWEEKLPSHIKLAYLPSPGIVRLRISVIQNRGNTVNTLKEYIDQLYEFIGDYVYGYDNDTLEEVVGKLLINKSLKVATAESCTGGTISKMLTSISGSSGYFKGGVVAYANAVKCGILNVKPETIEKHGAVSKQVAIEMVKGVQELLETDCAIAVTGIAGPLGGSIEKPVGTTWIAVMVKEHMQARKFQFGEHRERNITKASISALNLLRKLISEYCY